MHNKIFITVEGGIIQNIDVTEDLDEIDIIVIDICNHKAEGTKTLPDGDPGYVYASDLHVIADGDVQYFKEIFELCNIE